MTNYKTLYEQQVKMNKELKEQIQDIWAEQRETEENFDEEMLKNEKLTKRLEDAEHEAEQWEDSYNELNEKNKKLTKMNRILNASVQRNIKGDWKNKFYALEEEATLESQSLEAQIRAMKPISKDTKKEYDVVLKAQIKELTELEKKIAGYEEYQKEVDDMENNLLDLLERHEVRDAEGHLYTTNDSEVRHYDVLGVVETLLTRLSQTPIMIYKSQE